MKAIREQDNMIFCYGKKAVNVDTIITKANEMNSQLTKWRRFFHRYAEVGWTEYITTATIAEILTELGWEVILGRDILVPDARLGLPTADALAEAKERALSYGVSPRLMKLMDGGYTGLCATLRGNEEGKTVCLRFDIDANDLTEATDDDHRPYREGFASVHDGCMHACGHDGHIAVGLGTAALLAERRNDIKGTVMLLFQSAEEGVRGASGISDTLPATVDELYGFHLGFALTKTGTLGASTTDFLATTKLDAAFKGAPAHAGARPDGGKNALLAAATAALQLHALPRRTDGISRINVGTLHAGEGRNTIPAHATLTAEVRGETTAISRAMTDDAKRVLTASAMMYDTTVDITTVGQASSLTCDDVLAKRAYEIARNLGIFSAVHKSVSFGASEDFTVLAERVQAHGGQADYLIVGTELMSGHHTDRFDFDEDALPLATALFTALILAD